MNEDNKKNSLSKNDKLATGFLENNFLKKESLNIKNNNFDSNLKNNIPLSDLNLSSHNTIKSNISNIQDNTEEINFDNSEVNLSMIENTEIFKQNTQPQQQVENISSIENEIQSPERQINNSYTKPKIKTYRDFAVKALSGNSTSLAEMIIKEKRKKEIKHKRSIKNTNNILKIILSIFLVLLGITAMASVIIFVVNKNDEVLVKNQSVEPKSLIFYDYKTENLLDDLSRKDIFSIAKKVRSNNIPIGDIKIFYFTKRDQDGYKILANSKDLFDILDTRAPHQFKSNLTGDATMGILSTSDGKEPFMILKMNDFDSSYANILSWEKNMMFDFGAFFGIDKKYYSQKFVDLVAHNKDIRAILDGEGYLVFGYSFIEQDTLIFFTSNNQFNSLLETLLNKKEKS